MLLASQSILFYRDMCTSALRAMFLPWPATCGLSIIFTKAVRISRLEGWWFVELLLLLLLVSMSLASFERKWRNSLIDSYWLQMHRRCIVGSPRAMQTQRVCSSTQLIRGRRAPAWWTDHAPRDGSDPGTKQMQWKEKHCSRASTKPVLSSPLLAQCEVAWIALRKVKR